MAQVSPRGRLSGRPAAVCFPGAGRCDAPSFLPGPPWCLHPLLDGFFSLAVYLSEPALGSAGKAGFSSFLFSPSLLPSVPRVLAALQSHWP